MVGYRHVHPHDSPHIRRGRSGPRRPRERGGARVARRDEFDPVHDAYPGSEVPTYILDSHGPLATVKLTRGFTLEGRPGAVFNTRIETALDQLRRDRLGMWANAIA